MGMKMAPLRVPISSLKTWSPFYLDALGLVTLLRAGQVNEAVGRLIQSPYVRHLPLAGAYTVACNAIVKPYPELALYNISDGIYATDLACWFCRRVSTTRVRVE
jgi:hypothetical protein